MYDFEHLNYNDTDKCSLWEIFLNHIDLKYFFKFKQQMFFPACEALVLIGTYSKIPIFPNRIKNAFSC